MCRILIASAFIWVLAVPLCAYSAAPAAGSGAIYVVTLPAGADLWVDGTYVGRTPVLVDGLTRGRHMITGAKTAWESREVAVTVGGALPFQFIDFPLERSARAPRANGKIAVRAPFPLDNVAIDGIPVTLSPDGAADLLPGPHEVAVRTSHGSIVRRIVVYAETTTNLVLRGGDRSDERAAVIAPASRYLPPSAIVLEGRSVTIRHNGHGVSGTIGDPTMRVDGVFTTFDSPPTLVGAKLYLPLELYTRLGIVSPRAR